MSVHICPSLEALVTAVEAGAGAAFIAEEGLFGRDLGDLTSWIERQPPWSDLPFIVLTSHQEQPAVVAWRQKLVAALRNVSLLERPLQPITLTTTVRAALRARARQYEIRDLLAARERAAQELEALVAERTRALEEANGQLRKQMGERARVEESLRQAQKIEAIGQLTGGVAHDFNNLLMVISGGLDMLDRHTDPTRRQRLMDGMRLAAKRGAGLTRQLLAFSRRQELKPKPVDVAQQIGGMRELLDRSLRGDVHVTFEFPDGLWAVEVDAGELELVILNLAVNARDAMPDGGTITVRAENRRMAEPDGLNGDFVFLTVSDTGTGMPPEIRARVFEPFFTTKDIGKGSGLGLAQAHGFATQSGGALRIESEVGRGTTVLMYLPRSGKTPERHDHLIDLHVERSHPAQAGSVLLVEDDDEVAELVSQMLHQLGYDAIHAASPTAALGALADDRAIDLVLSDIMMPGGINGVQLAREIRHRRADLPILLTSGYAEAARHAADAEGIQILAKPYRLEDLSAALSTIRSTK